MPEARLIVTRSAGPSGEVTVGDEIRIGRAADNDIVLDDPRVSRRHAVLRKLSEDEFILIDLGSANGTKVNGVPLQLPSRLSDGDVVRIGSSSITFVCERIGSPLREDTQQTVGAGPRDVLGLLGAGPAMTGLFQLLDRAAGSNLPVLILGETGTGKELVARAVHAGGSRRSHPFVAVSCAGLSESALEGELFGGTAQEGGDDRVRGLAGAASGSLFLDEVADLPARLQARLLRVLEDRELPATAGEAGDRIDVRVISATNRELDKEVELGRFRADLFYRLAGFTIDVPALRDRREDIPLLCERFVAAAAGRLGKRICGIDEAALERLTQFDWPGNVRQLKNEIERALALVGDGGSIGAEHLSPAIRGGLAEQRATAAKDTTGRTAHEATEVESGAQVFRRDGEFWTVIYEGTKVLLKDSKGYSHIARMLAEPRREFAVQEFASEVEGEAESASADWDRQQTGGRVSSSLGDTGPALDARAKVEYRQRLRELNEELEEAERNHDSGGAERARTEIDFLVQQISSAVGLAGRDRLTGSHNERARIVVTQRIRSAIKRISESHPELGKHLTSSIRTGYRCAYQPSDDSPPSWRT